MTPLKQVLAGVQSEIRECLDAVSEQACEQAARDILSAKKIVVAAAGRSAAAMRASVIRLRHLGLDAYFIGEASTPPVGSGDLLIVGSGSGRTSSVVAQAQKAKQNSLRLLLFTIDPESELADLADTIVVIPAPSPKAASNITPQDVHSTHGLVVRAVSLAAAGWHRLIADGEPRNNLG